MDEAYLRKRLEASLSLMRAAVDPRARTAHLQLASSYRRLLRERADPALVIAVPAERGQERSAISGLGIEAPEPELSGS